MRKSVMMLLAVALMVVVVLAEPAAALDVGRIIISHDKDYWGNAAATDPYGISILINGTGVTSLSVVDPHSVGHVLSDQGDGMWYFAEHAAFADLTALDASYGPGDYVFTFNAGEADEDTVTISYAYTELTGFANITYPAYGQTNVPLNPIYTWDSVAGYANADSLFMAVMENASGFRIYDNFPGSDDLTPTSWQPGPLSPLTEYEFGLSLAAVQGDAPAAMQTDGFDDFVYSGRFGNWNSMLFETGPKTPGDANLDGMVDGNDLTTILTYWGQTGLGQEFGDLNGNGTVDGPDYSEVLSYWGTAPEPSTDVPEPATLALLLLGGLVVLGQASGLSWYG